MVNLNYMAQKRNQLAEAKKLLYYNLLMLVVLLFTGIKKKFVVRQSFIMSSSEDNNVSKIKAAASLLVKGGTLTSEVCHKCSGVQVRIADKTTCINCGNVVNRGDAQPKAELDKTALVKGSGHLTSAATLIEEKIALIASEIRLENDVSMQRQKATLLETYLRILEKTKSLIE
jgi:uncharacterized Zn finger protein (UPF0148 family)